MNKMYVYFDTISGAITCITSIVKNNNDDYVEVDIEDVRPLLEKHESPHTYIVEFDNILDKFIFKRKGNLNQTPIKISNLIYKLPTIEVEDVDITVIQDFPNTCWKFLIGSKLLHFLKNNQLSLKTHLYFSVTEYNNPNILYKTLVVNLEQLAKQHYYIIDFDQQFESNKLLVSLYTVKRFDTYYFKRELYGQ